MNGNDLYRYGSKTEYYNYLNDDYPSAQGIYLWTDPNGFQYVGKSDLSLAHRSMAYLHRNKSNNIFMKRSISLHGPDKMICTCVEAYTRSNRSFIDALEIDTMIQTGSSFPNGFNLQPYGIEAYKYVYRQLYYDTRKRFSTDILDDFIFRLFFLPEYMHLLNWYINVGLFDRSKLYRYSRPDRMYMIF